MKVNTMGRRFLSWLLLFAFLMPNISLGVTAAGPEVYGQVSLSAITGVTVASTDEPTETEPTETEPTETEPTETEPAETEPEPSQSEPDPQEGGSENEETVTSGEETQVSYTDATALEQFAYTLDAGTGRVILTKYTGTDAAVVVAPVYTVEDTVYTTVLDSTTVFRENTKITSVKLYAGVGFANNTMDHLFHKCTKLTSADLQGVNTVGVTDMSYLFGECGQLTTANLTGIDTSGVTTMYATFSGCYKLANLMGYQDWNTSSLENIFWMFNKVQGMQTIDLSKWDLSKINNSAWCFQHCYAQQILLPDNLKTISAGFLNHASKIQGSTFTIPAGVEKIGYAHTIYDFATDDFVEFIVAEGNRNYVAIDGILYSADGKEMLAIPRNKTFENNTYAVPEGVEFFGELSFSRNYNIHTLLLPNSYEIVQNIPAHDPRYIIFEDIGNLNAGNSLSIAIYAYTGVKSYEVKADNPRYASVDGILYSKDMSTLLAVPTRYDRYMDIPEGVTDIAVEAMWGYESTDGYMASSTGVNIPSTLTSIAPDQLAKLNRLNQKYPGFVITVHPDNPVFKLDADGNLVAEGVVVARNERTRASYPTLAEALAAAQSGDSILLLEDIALNGTVTVSQNVTINGNGHTITRGKNANGTWYTGVLFSVNAGAALTLDGNLIIDGANKWTLDKDGFMADLKTGTNGHPYAAAQTGGPGAAQNLFAVAGTVNVNNTTIRNNWLSRGLFIVQSGAAVNLNSGTLIFHNYRSGGGAVGEITVGGTVTINAGAVIKENYGYNTNGSMFTVAGSLVMNGGEICGNYGNSSGMIMTYSNNTSITQRPSFTMTGGSICHNSISPSGWGAVVYVHAGGKGSVFTMTGGYIGENNAYRATAIVGNGTNSEINLLGGTIKAPAGYYVAHPEVLFYGSATVGEAMDMEGEALYISLDSVNQSSPFVNEGNIRFKTVEVEDASGANGGGTLTGDGVWTFDAMKITGATTNLTLSEGTFLGDLQVTAPAVLTITGGSYSDLESVKYLDEGLGLAKNADGTYTVTDQVAQVNGVVYHSLPDALAAAGEGDTVKLLAIVPVRETIRIDQKVVIDLNGNELYATVDSVVPMIRVLDDVTVLGEGGVDAATFGSGQVFGVGAPGNAGALTIQGGSHYGTTTVASVTQGSLNITGGYFEATPYTDENGVDHGHQYTLISDEAAYADGSATINVSGGTYYGFDPQNNQAQGDSTDFVADKHWSETNSAENTWSVYPCILVVFQDMRMFVGDSVPAAEYVVNYNTIPQDQFEILVEATPIVNPTLGEHVLTGTVKVLDASGTEVDYMVAVEPGTLRVVEAVARIVETGERCESLEEAIAKANELGTATVELLKDVQLSQMLTVTGQVTLLGDGHILTRGKLEDDSWYTETLFAIREGAGLTLGGGLIIDGGNEWTYNKTDGVADLKTVVDNYSTRVPYTKHSFITYEAGGPVATAAMLSVGGNVVIEDATIRNNVGARLIQMVSGGKLTTKSGAVFHHNAGEVGAIVNVVAGSEVIMEGGTITQTVSHDHGGCVRITAGTFTMNGGLVKHNYNTGHASFVRLNGGDFIMNGGEICENVALPFGSGNNAGSVIDAKYGTITVTGGSIHNNYGLYTGGINHIGAKLTITGGSLVDNTAWLPVADKYNDDIFYASTDAKPARISGGIFSTEIYSSCTNADPAKKQEVTPVGYEEFVIGTDGEGNPNLWEVAPGWIITFQDQSGNALQSGPVREGEIPVLEGLEAAPDGYVIVWDKPIVPATEDATYTMSMDLIVAEVVAGDTHKGYFGSLQAAVDAAASGDTVRLLKDISLTDTVTVSGKDIILDGNDLTVTRGKLADDSWYTGTLLNVSADAKLALDGDLIIDGGNAWAYNKTNGVADLKNAVDHYEDFTGYSGLNFITPQADAPIATADMISVQGDLTLNAVTVRNHYSNAQSVIELGTTGKLTMNGEAALTHNAQPNYGTVIWMNSGSQFVMNGGVMSQNVGAHHGVCVYMVGGVMTVNGGQIMHNHTCGGQGTFVRLNTGAELIVNGGEVYENVAFPSPGNSRNKVGAVIDATGQSKVTIHDVNIHDNFGYWAGSVNHVSTKGEGALTITGGKFVNNTAWAAFDEDSRLSDISIGQVGGTITGGVYSTEIYQACVLKGNKDTIIPLGYEEFVVGTDGEGNPNLWEVAPGWIITFQDESGNVLQSGPVRTGEMPVFEAQVEIPEGSMIVWDKPIVPATETATYTMRVQLIVAEVVAGDTHKGYFPSLQAAVDAAASGDTVRILVDIPLTSKITVSGKEITLDGNDLTVTRGKLDNGKWYTGTLFTVSEGAALTLDGALTIDGGNNWTRKEDAYQAALEAERNATSADELTPYSGFAMITAETGAPVASARMFDVSGDVIINEACIRNHYGSSSNGLFALTATGSLTLNNKALLTHNADGDSAVIAQMAAGSEFTINEGAEISDSYFARNGGMVLNKGGLLTMNGGKVINNRGVNSNGTFVMLHTNNASFVMNGGEICGNTALYGSGAGWGCAIYLHNGSTAQINDGSICHNNGVRAGAICCNQAATGAKLFITGGHIVDNEERVGALWDMEDHHDVLQSNAGHFDGITGGFFTQDVTEYCTEGYYAFVVESDTQGNPTLWEVAKGWIITFQDENGQVMQSGPVRDGTLPEFRGEMPSRDDYLPFWDQEIVPATKAATYSLIWRPIVAEVVDADTHKGYFAFLQDAVDAAVTGDTVRILVDIPLTEKVTVSGKDITLDGNNLTITRGKLENGKWYTGTLLAVSADAALTLDGNLTVDGANAWIFKEDAYKAAFEDFKVTLKKYGPSYVFVENAEGGAVSTADMVYVSGTMTINAATLCNSKGGSACRALGVGSKGSLIMNDGATITHNASIDGGVAISLSSGSVFTMNGGEITDNHAIKNGMIYISSGTMIMKGGRISDNTGVNCNGTAVILYGNSKLIMNDGEICRNSSLAGTENGWNCVIYLHGGGSSMEMHGGYIYQNIGCTTGGIHVNTSTSKLTIDGGWVVENVSMLTEQSVRPDLAESFAGRNDVHGNTLTAISGITYFTQDVNKWCTTEYIAVPQDPGSMGISEDFTLWIVDKTSISSRIQEKEVFGTLVDGETTVSSDSAYTASFLLEHFYNRCYQAPLVHFSQELPEGTSLILRNVGRGEKGYWSYTVRSATDMVSFDDFIRMGTADEGFEVPMVKPEFQIVVDFSGTASGMPGDKLETSLWLIPADMLPTDDPDYYVSGAVRWLTEEYAQVLPETVGITPVETAGLADTECALSATGSGLTHTLNYRFTVNAAASKWDHRELALLVTIPDAPEDAQLFVNGSTEGLRPITSGCFIIPLGTVFADQLTLRLSSDMFPAMGEAYTATYSLHTADTVADASPLMGSLLSTEVECDFTAAAHYASVGIEEANDQRLFTARESVTVTVRHSMSPEYQIAVQLEKKAADGTYALVSKLDQGDSGSDYVFSLSGCENGSYRIVAVVTNKTNGSIVTQAPYYFLVDG